MPQRLAAILALIVFAICLLVGGLQAGNPFTTTVWRALVAMFWTFVIGLFVGFMAQRMLDENLKLEKEKLQNSSTEPSSSDR